MTTQKTDDIFYINTMDLKCFAVTVYNVGLFFRNATKRALLYNDNGENDINLIIDFISH